MTLPSLFVVPVTRTLWPVARADTGRVRRIVTGVDDDVVTDTRVPSDSVTVRVPPLMALTEPAAKPRAPGGAPAMPAAAVPESLMPRAAMVDPEALPTTRTLSPWWMSPHGASR